MAAIETPVSLVIAPRAVPSCDHRGHVLRLEPANVCGLRGIAFEVRACGLHGECAAGRYCWRQKIRSCAACIAGGENRSAVELNRARG